MELQSEATHANFLTDIVQVIFARFLSTFCQYFERLDDQEQTGAIPGWHDTRYKMIDAALRYRRFSDHAFSIIALVSTLPALFQALPQSLNAAMALADLSVPVLPLGAVVAGVAAVFISQRNSVERARLKDHWVFGEREGKSRWGSLEGDEKVDPYFPHK